MPTKYPTDFRVNVIRRYEKGESLKALSQELNISQSTLYQWRKAYCSIQTPNRTYTPSEFDAISRRLQKLEHKVEIIRLAGYITEVPLQKKLATLEELYNRPDNPYSIHRLCEALSVPRGTFYNHIFRRADKSCYETEHAQLALKVKQAFDDSDLRHTFAALSLQNGDDYKTLQGNLGHAIAAFILDEYGHVSERMKDDSAKRGQAYIDVIRQA